MLGRTNLQRNFYAPKSPQSSAHLWSVEVLSEVIDSRPRRFDHAGVIDKLGYRPFYVFEIERVVP